MIINKTISAIYTCISLGIATLFNSCINKSIDADLIGVETITIDYENGPLVCFDSIISDIRFIKLETKENNLVGNVDKMLIHDDKIIVVDRYNSKSIHVFNEMGKHISRISNVGNGPHEYLTITDVDITPSGLIAIKDNYKDVILYFNTNGTFEKKEEIMEGGLDIAFIDDHIIAHEIFQGGFNKHLKGSSLCITENNKIKTLFGNDVGVIDKMNRKRLLTMFHYNDTVYYSPSWEKYIYKLTSNDIKAKYKIELKPEDLLDHKFKTTEELDELEKSYNFFNGSFIELKDYTWLNYFTPNRKEPPVIYSHKEKIAYRISPDFSNPLLNYLQKPTALYNDNTVAEIVSALRVYTNQFTINSISGHSEITDSLHNGLTVDDNPVVFLFTFKDDISKYVIK